MKEKGSVSVFFCLFGVMLGAAGIAFLSIVKKSHESVRMQLKLDRCTGQLGLELSQSLNKLSSLNHAIVKMYMALIKAALAAESGGGEAVQENLDFDKIEEIARAIETQDKIIDLWDKKARTFSGCKIEYNKNKPKVILLSENLTRGGDLETLAEAKKFKLFSLARMHDQKNKLFGRLPPILIFGARLKDSSILLRSDNILSYVKVSGGDDGLSQEEPKPWQAKYVQPPNIKE